MQVENINVLKNQVIITPKVIKDLYPLNEEMSQFVYQSRVEIQKILNNEDERTIIIVGPCSIHDKEIAFEYARKLKDLSEKVKDKYLIVMRVYFEKPRTTVGWKGLINDPNLDDTFQIEKGLKLAREIMLEITKIGLPIATEALDPISPQYIADLVSWSAIGARTTESQTHREMASGLSSPVGFKNGTDGNVMVAVNAILSAEKPHAFLGINESGEVAIVNTKGNQYGHLILRGGKDSINYDSLSIKIATETMIKNNIKPNIIVDCSHSNAQKNYKNQPIVFEDVMHQIKSGNTNIKGIMIESNLEEGKQELIIGEKEKLKYGVSITDGCIDFETTKNLILKSY